MKHFRIRRKCPGLLIGLMLVASIGAAGQVPLAEAQESDTVETMQFFEVEGARPIGLSPDGQWMAAADFSSDTLCIYSAEQFEELVCANLDPLLAGLRIEDVAWSPDSTRLVLAERSLQLFRDGDLWVMDATTGELSNVADDHYEGNLQLGGEGTGETFSFDVAPAWTPDGQSITYSRSLWEGNEYRGNDIVTIPATGGEPVSLLTVDIEAPGVAYFRMRWTPDGQSLYYTVTSPNLGDERSGIYRYDVASGSRQQILGINDDDGVPALVEISPSSDRLLIWYPNLAGSYSSALPLYWVFDIKTGDLQPLIPPGADGPEDGFVAAAAFSPDGGSVLLGTRFTTPNFQLWEVDLTTEEGFLMVESLPGVMVMDYALPPSWTASGHVFVASNIGSGTLITVAPRESPMAEPVRTPTAESSPSASEFTVGQTVVVTTPWAPLFAAPSFSSQPVLLLSEGDVLTVLGSPEVGEENIQWLPVQHKETRTIGFVRVEFVTEP